MHCSQNPIQKNQFVLESGFISLFQWQGSEGKRPLGRPRRRWVDNIKMDLGEIGWDGRDWIELAQDMDQ
jgi:hypothetical protein